MIKKRIKTKLGLSMGLVILALLIPLYSVYALGGKIGQGCNDVTECTVDAADDFQYTNWEGTDKSYNENVRCISNRCVISTDDAAIGTWCSKSPQCNVPGDDFTCDTNNQYCIVGQAGINCIDETARLNQDPQIGTLGTDIPESERCSSGLVCDNPDTGSGKCQNDFGQGTIPPNKLGETASDIRDQIRNLINIALGFLGVGGVIVTIYGGALWMSAAGDDEKVGKAKKTIVSGLIGLVIIGIAWTIVSYVLNVTQSIA